MSRRRVLLTGATGLLAPYLVAGMSPSFDVVTTARRGGDVRCDLTDGDAVDALITGVRPDVVVHAAALTDVDACERCPDAATAANVGTSERLVATLPPETPLVLLSTDQVYRDVAGPHPESDVGPVNVYGRTKLASEGVALRRDASLVLRVNFFGPSRTPGRASLSDVVVERISSGAGMTGFADLLFSPLHMVTLADVVTTAIDRGLTGTFNVGSRDGMSKLDYARAVARQQGLDAGLVRSGSSADVATRAPRPHDLRMDVTHLEDALAMTMPTLDEEIAKL
jgi:dTDP-4-dehydrorhamnose reductase